LFLNSLETWTTDSKKSPKTLKLKELLSVNRNDAALMETLLNAALAFDDRRGEEYSHNRLVTSQCFFFAIQNCVRSGDMVRAEHMVRRAESYRHVQLSSIAYGVYLNGYVKQGTRKALYQIERTLERIEQKRMARMRQNLLLSTKEKQKTFPFLTSYHYNSLMNAYTRVLDKDEAVQACERMISRMLQASESFQDEALCPDLASYSTLMKAYIRRQRPGFANDVHSILDMVKKDKRFLTQSGSVLYVYNMTMDAWAKSDSDDALERAQEIFKAIAQPDTVSYNVLGSILVRRGQSEQVLELFESMFDEYNSKRNPNCKPDDYTFATSLAALLKSNQADAVARAERIFKSIGQPNTVTCNTMLNMYAYHRLLEKALGLVQKMKLNRNQQSNCQPDLLTYTTLLNAFHRSNKPDAVEQAKKVFDELAAPDVYCYTTMLNMYAERGRALDAVALTRRMQSDYDSKTNPHCRPNDATERALLKALELSDELDLVEASEDVRQWFRSVNP
jgi:pentatricopeptide repeat protein